MELSYCIQCKDRASGKVGDFLMEGASFVALSPVFDHLDQLFRWLTANGYRTDYSRHPFGVARIRL